MSNLGNLLQQLRAEHSEAEQQVAKLSAAISAIEGIVRRERFSTRKQGIDKARCLRRDEPESQPHSGSAGQR